MNRITVKVGSIQMPVELNDSETARKVVDALPIRSRARVWGEEIYFDTELCLLEEAPKDHAPPGTVAYWPQGKAICLFFGQKPASPVTIIGRMRGNPRDLAAVHPGDDVAVRLFNEDEKDAPR